MPSSNRIRAAALAALFLCLSTVGGAAAKDSKSESSVTLTALKFAPADHQLRITLEGNSPLTYNVYRPEGRLILVDLPGADAAKLQPSYSLNNDMVELVRVRQVANPSGKHLARLEIALRKEAKDKTRLDGNSLIIELAAVADKTDSATQKSATSISKITAGADKGQTVARIEANGTLAFKTFWLHNPERLVLDLPNVDIAVADRVIEVSSDNVTRIRVGKQEAKGARIVFDAKQQCEHRVEPAANGIVVTFASTGKTDKADKPKADKSSASKKTVSAPLAAPPDNTGIAGGSAAAPAKDGQSQIAKAETDSSKNSAEGRVPASVPSVKGIRPGIARSAAARAASAPAASVAADNPSDPQGAKLHFGDPGFIGDPISIDIAGVDINDILRFISDNYGENFILDRSVTSVTVTVKVNDVPWNQVIDSIFKANQLSYTREGAIVRIATLTALAVEQQQQRQIEEERINNLPKVSKFFRLRYTRLSGGGPGAAGAASGLGGTSAGGTGATGLVGIIRKNLSKVGEVDADPRTNQIIVTDIPQRIAAVEDIIAKLDVAEPQVEIEARIIVADRSFMRSIGNQLAFAATQSRGPEGRPGFAGILETSPQQLQNNPIRTDRAGSAPDGDNVGGGGLIGPVATGALAGSGATLLSLTTGVIGTSLLSTAITLSEQKGIAKTVSTPRITVQNNTSGDITSGTQIAVQTEVNNTVTTTFVTAALRLNVTPQIVDEGNVLLRIIIENNGVDRSLRTTGGTPSIITQRAETLVLVPDGGTTILGGVNLDTEGNVIERTPGISRIPFVGELFKKRQINRSSRELLFFVTPRIYRPESLGIQSAPPAPAPTQSAISGTTGER